MSALLFLETESVDELKILLKEVISLILDLGIPPCSF
jgi:hypothetical protein